MSFLENSWEQREEQVYKSLFNDLGSSIYPLDAAIFQSQFQRQELDPRWLHYGVFRCPPTDKRNNWVYISSGMSNPWESDTPEKFSGLGVEFLLETKSESDWAINALRSLIAFNILLSVGHFGEKPLVDYGDRIPLKIEPSITNVMVVEPKNFPTSFELISGKVDILQITGITASELDFAKQNSSSELAEIIYEQFGTYAVLPTRESAKKV